MRILETFFGGVALLSPGALQASWLKLLGVGVEVPEEADVDRLRRLLLLLSRLGLLLLENSFLTGEEASSIESAFASNL